MAIIEGMLHLDLQGNGTVQFLFMPITGSGGKARPLLAKDTAQAEYDLMHTWNFSAEKARTATEDLGKSRHVELLISVEQATVSSLFE